MRFILHTLRSKNLYILPHLLWGVIELLQKTGLTESESKVYLALLDLGEAKTGDILKHAGLNSGRIYEILASLEQKGLASSSVKKRVRLFIPAPPTRVIDLLKQQQQEIDRRTRQIERALPDLTRRFEQAKQDVKIETFIGGKGQRTAYELFLNQATKDKELRIYGIVAKERYPRSVLDNLKYYVYKERRKHGIRSRKIAAEEARKESFYDRENSETRFLPHTTMTGFQAYGDMTMLTYEQEPLVTILIHSSEIANDYRQHFDFLWSVAKR